CELRNSLLGLLRVRTTSFSNRDGTWYAGTTEPISRLQGSSLSGSAAAPVSKAPTPVVVAPANMMPRPSSARRSSSPLPATGSGGGAVRRLRLVMGPLPSGLRRLEAPVLQLLPAEPPDGCCCVGYVGVLTCARTDEGGFCERLRPFPNRLQRMGQSD